MPPWHADMPVTTLCVLLVAYSPHMARVPTRRGCLSARLPTCLQDMRAGMVKDWGSVAATWEYCSGGKLQLDRADSLFLDGAPACLCLPACGCPHACLPLPAFLLPLPA